MKRFDKKGMLLIPDPRTKDTTLPEEKILVIEECYCPNGHSLISSRVKFDSFAGILFKVSNDEASGLIALSPVYGEKYRISLDLDLRKGEILVFYCPECNTPLPAFKNCECGGNLTAFFTTKEADFNYSIGICNRVDCHNATIHLGQEMIKDSLLESF